MNILTREKQIEIISALTEGLGIRATARVTGTDRGSVASALYVAFYNFARVHESLRTAPALVLGITDHVWSIGELLDAALATQPIKPTTTAPDRRKQFRVIDGGKS